MKQADVIVVGAGMAGAAATLKLAKAGKRVLVIEARDRCGGRGFTRPFAGGAETLEFGGAWITPWHHRVRFLVEEHGLSLRPRHEVTNRLWLRNGELTSDGPAGREDAIAHDRAIARVAADAILLKKGITENERGEALAGISFAAYLKRLSAPKATQDMFSAWWTVSGNGGHDDIAASEFLSSCAYDGGLAEGQIKFWADTVVPGMGELAERMIAASGAEFLRSTPVTEVRHAAHGIEIVCGGNVYRASAAVMALGINQLKPIVFEPALSNAKQGAIAAGHGGRSFKLWIKLEGVPAGTLVTGDGSGIEFAFAERKTEDGATLVVAFGLMNELSRPDDPAWVKSQAARLFPNAHVISYDWHNWNDDPFARGTWVAARAGHEAGLGSSNWQPEGKIAFASSDYARDQAGWFEGAVNSGEDASEALLGTL